MLHLKEILFYSLVPTLAASVLCGSGFASHRKKNSNAATANTTMAASVQNTGTVESTPAKATEQRQERGKAPAANSNVSPGDIASAKAKGMVWVNTESKKYHKGGRYYGKTKHGKFMTEADAKKVGYQSAKR